MLPQIAVRGDESAGKSSVLEGTPRRPFLNNMVFALSSDRNHPPPQYGNNQLSLSVDDKSISSSDASSFSDRLDSTAASLSEMEMSLGRRR